MTTDLSNQQMLITGAAAGIGRAVALAASAAGARVSLADRNAAGLEETAEMVVVAGGEALTLPCDVTDEEGFSAAVERAVAWGGLRSASLIAGIELFRKGDDRVDRLDIDVWRQIIDVNLTGMFISAKYASRALIAGGGGSIAFAGSPCGITGKCGNETAYSASKSGVHGLVRIMAASLAEEKVRVNAVIPGFVATQLNEALLADPQMLAETLAGIPARRAAQPKDIAPMFVWVASGAADYVTGAFLTVDGGMTAV